MTEREEILDHEGRISRVEECTKQILENHLPHIHESLKELRVWVRGTAIAAILTLLSFIIDHFVR